MPAIVEASRPQTFPVTLQGSAHVPIPEGCILNLQTRKHPNVWCLNICTELQLVWSVDKKCRCLFQFIFSSSVEILCDFSKYLDDLLIVVSLSCDRFDNPFLHRDIWESKEVLKKDAAAVWDILGPNNRGTGN